MVGAEGKIFDFGSSMVSLHTSMQIWLVSDHFFEI